MELLLSRELVRYAKELELEDYEDFLRSILEEI